MMLWSLFPLAALALDVRNDALKVGEHSLLQTEEECDDVKEDLMMTHTEEMMRAYDAEYLSAEADGSYVEMEADVKPPLPVAARRAPRVNKYGGVVGGGGKVLRAVPGATPRVAPTPKTVAKTALPAAYRVPDWRLQRWHKKIQRFDENDKLRFLGKGSFGTVIKAVPVCDPNSATAAKIMKSGCTSRSCFQKFVIDAVSEVSAMEQFTPEALGSKELSDRFVQIIPGEYGVGPKTDTEYSFMMTLGSGDVRKTFTSKQPMQKRSMTEMVILLGDMLDGFNAMHERGFVHRDVKPANVMVRCYGATTHLCHPQIGDLGMTCAMDVAVARRTKVQHCPVALAGTPLYMAPEFVRSNGKPQTINDMWSVGLIMYEAVFGRLPGTMESQPTIQAIIKYIKNWTNDITLKSVTEARIAGQFSGRKADDAAIVALAKIMRGMLHPSPKERMTAAAALVIIEPFLTEYRASVLPMPFAGLPACWSDESPDGPAAAAAPAQKSVQRPGTAFPGKKAETRDVKKTDDGQSEVLPAVIDRAVEGFTPVQIKLLVGGGDPEAEEAETDDEHHAKNLLDAAMKPSSDTNHLEEKQGQDGALPEVLQTGQFVLVSVDCDNNVFTAGDLLGNDLTAGRLLSGMYGDVDGAELIFRYLKKD